MCLLYFCWCHRRSSSLTVSASLFKISVMDSFFLLLHCAVYIIVYAHASHSMVLLNRQYPGPFSIYLLEIVSMWIECVYPFWLWLAIRKSNLAFVVLFCCFFKNVKLKM